MRAQEWNLYESMQDMEMRWKTRSSLSMGGRAQPSGPEPISLQDNFDEHVAHSQTQSLFSPVIRDRVFTWRHAVPLSGIKLLFRFASA